MSSNKNGAYVGFLKDKPLLYDSEDRLNFNSYVSAMCEMVMKSYGPISIGIHGEWGAGKTSFMQLLKNKLNEEIKKSSENKLR